MKNILIWSYHFPPEGGPGVQRITKLIKNLPQDKYRVFVITSKRKLKVLDYSLLEEIKYRCKIFHVKDYYSYLLGDIKKLLRSVMVPDKAYLWSLSAYYKAKSLHKKHNFDLIISTSPPHSSHIFACKLATHLNIKCIIEFRDEWTSNSLFERSKKQNKQIEMENTVLRNCSHIVTISETAKRNLQGKNLSNNKIDVIYNGFDEDDFKEYNFSDHQIEPNRLKIGYMGRLNTLHSPKSFFSVLSKLSTVKDDLTFQCTIIGDKENSKWIKPYPLLKENFTILGYMEHHVCLEEISKSDILLLLSTNSNKTEVVTGKVFEYFRLKKPIFAILSSKGELYNILVDYNNAYIAYDDDPESISEELLRMWQDFRNHNLVKKIPDTFIDRFDRKQQAKQYIEIIEGLF